MATPIKPFILPDGRSISMLMRPRCQVDEKSKSKPKSETLDPNVTNVTNVTNVAVDANVTNVAVDANVTNVTNVTNVVVDPIFYRRAYRDLRQNVDAVGHYHLHGKNENRLASVDHFQSLYPDFDLDVYIKHNLDLKHLTSEGLFHHFHHCGRKENRVYQRPVSNQMEALSSLELNSRQVRIKSGLTSLVVNGRKYLEETNLGLIEANYPVGMVKLDEKLRETSGQPVYLVMAEWGLPAFGGGECWLIDTMKWLKSRGFTCYYIYFSDPTKSGNFEKISVIPREEGTFIQFTPNLLELLQFIRDLNPVVISHQGCNRMKFLKIANLLGKPFVSGFCFWGDILHMSNSNVSPHDPDNRRMLTKALIGDDNFRQICQNSQYVYACGSFLSQVVKKVHGLDLDVIETITDPSRYQIKVRKPEYVTMINICGLKGGNILGQVMAKTRIGIPFLLIDSQDLTASLNQELGQMIQKRNLEEKKMGVTQSVYIKGAVDDMSDIYGKTQILLVPSLVDETFCRVAYEGMMNGLPVLSTKNGNLPYLLRDYADFLDENPDHWSRKLNDIYLNSAYLAEMSQRPRHIDGEASQAKFVDQIMKLTQPIRPNPRPKPKAIGILCPWGDQGLGIQCREYYGVLRTLGFEVHILSFRPYHATGVNPRLQTEVKEWEHGYTNLHYSPQTREKLSHQEMIDFIYDTRISKMIIVETCFGRVFDLAKLCRLLGVEVYAIPNLETIRYSEVTSHNFFDQIICNNQMTYDLLSLYFPQMVTLMGFQILHKYFNPNKKWNRQHYSFFCSGGMNALTRKNVDKILQAFKDLETDKHLNNFKLYVYIQGVEIPDHYQKWVSPNVIISVGSQTYKDISLTYRKHDVFIHMGGHEGLGLGLYESIACGTPVLTIDSPPNNEIIREGQNGWLIPCTYAKLTDNPEGIVKKAMVTTKDIKMKMLEIMDNYDRKRNHDQVIADYLARYPIASYYDRIRQVFSAKTS